MNNRISRLAMLSALAVSGLSVAAESEVEPESQPRYVPPSSPFPPRLEPPPPPTPEQIKAQEKRARKAAKWAKLNQADPDPRAVTKLVNSGYPGAHAEDVLSSAYSTEDVVASIRADGGDPEGIGQRGVAFVKQLLSNGPNLFSRSNRQKEKPSLVCRG